MKCPVCKKNIPDKVLKCPHCKTRVGIICSNCNTVNPVGKLSCSKCGNELLRICPQCGCVNFPKAEKCRKCLSPLNSSGTNQDKKNNNPKLITFEKALDTLIDGIKSKDKKIISITGEKGIGKSLLLKNLENKINGKNYKICIGKCSQTTQLTPGGVIQDMLLNLFKLPNFYLNREEINEDGMKFFANEFKFLTNDEISSFINFLYSSIDGKYEDIILNKQITFRILDKIFDALCNTGKFIFIIDNFDLIDGFSVEFLTNFTRRKGNWKNLKLIVTYEKHKAVEQIFPIDCDNCYLDIPLAKVIPNEITSHIENGENYFSMKEKEIILRKSGGNCAFFQQAASYCFDCQIADKTFLLPQKFSQLISERLDVLKKVNNEAFKVLCGAVVLGNKINLFILKEAFGLSNEQFNDIVLYLIKSNYIHKFNDIYYEFNSNLLWETILKEIKNDSIFEDINVKIGKILSVYALNSTPTMIMISHNLKEMRMAFDLWTKITRLASYTGDINLYVISQKQCLAILNEFNENETLDIRYNISERLGKILSQYSPQDALEYLPDAISRANEKNDEVKEIELLGYLAQSCKKIGNYFGDIECCDNVIKHIPPSKTLEIAMVKASKIPSSLSIGNFGEVINIIENDILPILNSNLKNPKLDTQIPLELVAHTRIKIYLYLAQALGMQGDERAFEVLDKLFDIITKEKIKDVNLISKAKLVLAYANTVKGDFQASFEMLENLSVIWNLDNINMDSLDFQMCENINYFNLIYAINKCLLKDFSNLKEDLCSWAMFAQNSGNEYVKNIIKTILGKIFCDTKQAKHALEIYNEQITYFAEKKFVFGALLCWYFISEATLIASSTKDAIDTAQRALDIARNPKINNYYFICLLNIILAKAHMKDSDYESAKINLDNALSISKKRGMYDLQSKIYFIYGKYYQDLGSIQSPDQSEYLNGSKIMYNKALDIVLTRTKSVYMKQLITEYSNTLVEYCEENSCKV